MATYAVLNLTGSSNACHLRRRMMSYVYVPNSVEISLNVPEMSDCLES